MNPKQLLFRYLKKMPILMGLLCFGAIVWFAAPLIPYGETHPLEGAWPRVVIIAVGVALVGGFYAFRYWRKRKAEKAIEAALKANNENSGDGEVLATRMTEAIDTLKRSSGKQSFLYELPWYVIIGPPGAGKTTALVNSGLKFPLAGKDGAASIAGVGGTRYCDFWFTEDAVLIDTAGRY
nr:type VI secretion system membrane subunit TssM [Pseudaminobacter sp.]